jgi:hypothetical protein
MLLHDHSNWWQYPVCTAHAHAGTYLAEYSDSTVLFLYDYTHTLPITVKLIDSKHCYLPLQSFHFSRNGCCVAPEQLVAVVTHEI